MYPILLILATAVLITIDQLTKLAAVAALGGGNTAPILPGFLEFSYSENTGIAWGLFPDSRWLVITVTGLMLAFLFVVLLTGRFRHSRLITAGGVMVLAGGVGNLIDRVMNGYVVDFIHAFWDSQSHGRYDFPIFNVADCCVTIGAMLILVYFFFCGSKEKAKEAVTDGNAKSDADDTANRKAS